VGSLVVALGGYSNAMLTFSGAFAVAWMVLFFDKNTRTQYSKKLSEPI